MTSIEKANQADPEAIPAKQAKEDAVSATSAVAERSDVQVRATAAGSPTKIDRAVAEAKAQPTKDVPARKAKKTRKTEAGQRAKKPSAISSAASKIASTTEPKPTRKSIRPPYAAVTQMKETIMATASKTNTEFAAKAQEMASEAQARAKAAYEKLQSYAGEITAMTKGNLEAMAESGKILGSGLQEMARGEVEAAKGAFETATADLKAMAAVKSPTELLKLQSEIARRNFDAMVARAAKNAEVSMKLAGDAFAPISSRMSLAAEKVSQAT